MCAIFATVISLGTAYAWLGSFVSPVRTINAGSVFKYYNEGAYEFTANEAFSGSFMNVCNSTNNSPAGTIQVQAASTIGTSGGIERDVLGDRVLNWNGSGPGEYITSIQESELFQANGIGDIGALAWGSAQITSTSDGQVHRFYSDYICTITTVGNPDGSCYYTSGWQYNELSNSLGSETSWIPGESNFTNEDGVVFGVPYFSENGEMTVPDMLRVGVDDGSYGYIDMDDLNNAAYCDLEYRQMSSTSDFTEIETKAFQDAFSEYYGVDALSHESAMNCAELLRYDNTDAKSAQVINKDTRVKLATPGLKATVNPGDSSLSNPVLVSESDFSSIKQIVREKLTVFVPLYDEDGVTIIGEYKFVKI